jgi:hypothetical protein
MTSSMSLWPYNLISNLPHEPRGAQDQSLQTSLCKCSQLFHFGGRRLDPVQCFDLKPNTCHRADELVEIVHELLHHICLGRLTRGLDVLVVVRLRLSSRGLALLRSEVLLMLRDIAQQTLDIALGPLEITLSLYALALLFFEMVLELNALVLRLLEVLLELSLSRGAHVGEAGGGCVGKWRGENEGGCGGFVSRFAGE